jgi:hypothetical protein
MKEHSKEWFITVWSGANPFLDEYYARKGTNTDPNTQGKCFRAMFGEIGNQYKNL